MSNKELIDSMVIVDFQEDGRVQVENNCKNIGILMYLGYSDSEIEKATHGTLIDVAEMITSLEDGFLFKNGKFVQEV